MTSPIGSIAIGVLVGAMLTGQLDPWLVLVAFPSSCFGVWLAHRIRR